MFCPASVVPIGSIVPEIISGSFLPAASYARAMPMLPAFTFSVSCDVSSSNTSTPASTNASACSS
ncbi:hypothetical protein D3C77_673140 [compost metagenome]